MSLRFSTSTGGVSFPHDSRLGGLYNLSVAITLTPDNPIAGNQSVFQKWGPNSAWQQLFILCKNGTANLQFVLFQNGGWYGYRTDTSPLVGGTLIRVVCRVFDLSGAGKGMDIWVNGVKHALVDVSTYGGNVVMTNNFTDNQTTIGYDVVDALAGIYGQYAEAAIWAEKVPDWFAAAYGQGVSPAFYQQNGRLYAPLVNGLSGPDVWGSKVGTVTAGAVSTHPSIAYPRGRHGLTTSAVLDEAIKGGDRAGQALLL